MIRKLTSGCSSMDKRTQFSVKTMYYVLFLLCACNADGNTSVTYKDVEKFGYSCPALDSCTWRSIYRRQQAPIKDCNCHCDPLCSEYGDCCIDALWKERDNRNDLKCLQVEQIGGVYMKDSCPPSYKGPEEVKQRCEKTEVGSQTDPLGSMPVTDPLTGVTYKNYYCNMCNEKSDSIVMWTPKLECPLLSLMNTSGDITKEYVLQNLVTDGHSWGLYLNDESDGSSFFHDCSVYPVLPPQLETKIRPCKPRLISDCSPSWGDSEIRAMCRSYTGVRFDHRGNGYRNVHCAICNGINATRLSCRSIEEIDIFREVGLHSFALLMDFGEGSGEEVGMIRICKREDLFDPFFKKCRSVVCLPGFVRRGRRCVMRNPIQPAKILARLNKRIVKPSTTPKYQENHSNGTIRHAELLPTPLTLNITELNA